MLEIIFGLIPLIFVCASIGLVLINFGAVANYVVYVLSMLTSPQQLIETTYHITPQPAATINKKKFNPLMIFVRLFILIRTLFLPSVNITTFFEKPQKLDPENAVNIISQEAVTAAGKYDIKTYNLPVQNTQLLRNSFDQQPITAPPNQTNHFSAFTQFLDTRPEKSPTPALESDNLITPQITAYNPSQQVQVTQPTTDTESTQKSSTSTIRETPSVIQPVTSEIQTSIIQQTIATAPRQVPPQLQISQESNYVILPNNIPTLTPTTSASSTVLSTPPPLPTLNVEKSPIETFQARHDVIDSDRLLDSVLKALTYTITLLPLIAVLATFVTFLSSVNFDFSRLVEYPQWLSTGLEDFVQTVVIPTLNNQ